MWFSLKMMKTWSIGSCVEALVGAGGDVVVPVEVAVPTRLLAHWADGWRTEAGAYRLRAGTSVVDLPLETTLEIAE